MFGVFSKCKELEYLDLSNLNTSNVKNMSYMFYECCKLKEIKGINNFNTINVTDMNKIFASCSNLECLDLSDFETSNVTNIWRICFANVIY